MKPNKIQLQFIVRLLVGGIFISSALFKLQSIDSFEIYIYSFGVCSLNMAFLSARLIIGLELFLGSLLILGTYLKRIIQISIAMLLGFSLFIGYLIVSNSNEHCHCFGDLVEMSHFYSILKNIVLILLLTIIYKSRVKFLKYSRYWAILALIISFALPPIVSPPDSLFYDTYAQKTSYNDAMLNTYLEEQPELKKDKKLLCFFSPACRFCKLSTRKITVIANKINQSNVVRCVFWGDKNAIENFYTTNHSIAFPYKTLDPIRFLKITNGEMPLIILLENGTVKGKYDYRSINEDEIIDFFQN